VNGSAEGEVFSVQCSVKRASLFVVSFVDGDIGRAIATDKARDKARDEVSQTRVQWGLWRDLNLKPETCDPKGDRQT
jgi:hypothetical protein